MSVDTWERLPGAIGLLLSRLEGAPTQPVSPQTFNSLVKSRNFHFYVIPAKAGIQFSIFPYKTIPRGTSIKIDVEIEIGVCLRQQFVR